MRTPSAPLGAPLILSPRISVPTTAASLLNGSGPPGSLLSAGDPHGLIYTPYADYANYAALAASPLLTEYATADHSGGLFARWYVVPRDRKIKREECLSPLTKKRSFAHLGYKSIVKRKIDTRVSRLRGDEAVHFYHDIIMITILLYYMRRASLVTLSASHTNWDAFTTMAVFPPPFFIVLWH